MKWLIPLVVVGIALSGCGGSPAITAQQVYERLQRSGLATNGRTVPAPGQDAVFAGCTDQYGFDMPGTGGLGVIFICPKTVSDTIMSQPTATPETTGALAGIRIAPYVYRSAGGTVLVSVAGTTPPDVAARIGDEVALIPE